MTIETIVLVANVGVACYLAYLCGKVVEGQKAGDRYEQLLQKYIAAERNAKN